MTSAPRSMTGNEWLLLLALSCLWGGVFFGSAVFGERLEIQHFAGMGLISLGLPAIDGRLFRLVQHRFFTRPAVLSAAEKES